MTDEEKKLVEIEKQKLIDKVTTLNTEKNTLINEFNTNESTLKQDRENIDNLRLLNFETVEKYDANTETQKEIDSIQSKIDDLNAHKEQLKESWLPIPRSIDDNIAALEIEKWVTEENLVELTPDEQKKIDEIKAAEEKLKNDTEKIENWEVIKDPETSNTESTDNQNNSTTESETAPMRKLWNSSIMNALTSLSDNWIASDISDKNGLTFLSKITKWVKDGLTSLLVIVSVWVFLFTWIRLWIARGNPEEFKKAFMQFLYWVVWIFVVSASWAVVKLISWLNL